MLADIISLPTDLFGTHKEGWGGEKGCVSNCVPCVPLCSCFALPPICSSKGVLLNAHVQHNVAWLVVSEIEAYLERIFLSYVHFASIRSHAILQWSLIMLQVSWTCHGHVMDMHVAWCMHDACMCIISWHVMPSSQHPLFTIRHPTQLNWPLLVTHTPSPLSQKWPSPQVDQLISNANISMRKRARGFKFGQEREDRALFHFGSRPEQAICHCRSKRGGASASPRLRLAKAAPNRGACLGAHARPAHALLVPP